MRCCSCGLNFYFTVTASTSCTSAFGCAYGMPAMAHLILACMCFWTSAETQGRGPTYFPSRLLRHCTCTCTLALHNNNTVLLTGYRPGALFARLYSISNLFGWLWRACFEHLRALRGLQDGAHLTAAAAAAPVLHMSGLRQGCSHAACCRTVT